MNVSVEKLITLLAIAAFIATSANSLSSLGDPITKEEAIEISKNSELVREGMVAYGYFSYGAIFHNSSWVEQTKKRWIEMWGEVPEVHSLRYLPEGRDIWEVGWTFLISEHIYVGYTVNVFIDAETGAIVYAAKGVGF